MEDLGMELDNGDFVVWCHGEYGSMPIDCCGRGEAQYGRGGEVDDSPQTFASRFIL